MSAHVCPFSAKHQAVKPLLLHLSQVSYLNLPHQTNYLSSIVVNAREFLL